MIDEEANVKSAGQVAYDRKIGEGREERRERGNAMTSPSDPGAWAIYSFNQEKEAIGVLSRPSSQA